MAVDITNLVHWACMKKNENIIKECIEMKYNLHEKTVHWFESPLMLAVKQQNNLNIIKLLIDNGADLNYVDYSGQCVLDCTSNEEYLSFLKSSGAIRIEMQMSKLAIEIEKNKECSFTTKEAVNQIDALGLTPFLWAINYQRQNYIDYYMKLGVDVNQAGRTGITPLMMTVYSLDLDNVIKLVKSGANVNQLDNNGLSAFAHCYCNSNIFDYLIESGAEIDPCTSGNGRSPLIIAAIQNDLFSFNYFLNKNANVNFIDSDGNTALSYAILNKDTYFAEKLIAKGANVDLCGPKGKTPLAWSVFINNPKITQFLLDNEADINYTDHQGKTALYYAEKYQYTEIIKLLKDNGAEPIKIRQNNYIFSAIQAKDIDSIKTLLGNLSIYHKNEENQTIIDVAVQVGDLNTTECFKMIEVFEILRLLIGQEKFQSLLDFNHFKALCISLLLERNNSNVHSAFPAVIQTKNIQLVQLL